MDNLEDFIMGPHARQAEISELPGAADFFLGLKEPLPKTAGAVGKFVSRAAAPKPPRPPKINSDLVARVRDAARSKIRARGAMPIPKAPKPPAPPEAPIAKTAGSISAAADGILAKDLTGARKMIASLPIERLRRLVKDPDALARAKGSDYYKAFSEGRAARKTFDPGGIVPDLNRAIRLKDGSITPMSVIKGLDDTGVMSSGDLVGHGYDLSKRIQELAAKRSRNKAIKKGLIAAGAVGGGGAVLYGASRRGRSNTQAG